MSTSVLPASHPFAAGSSRTYSPPSVGTTRRALVTQSTFCASWARDVAAITRLTSASASNSDSKVAPSPTPSPLYQSQPILLEAAIITERLPRTAYGPVPPRRERTQGSPSSSPSRSGAETTVKAQSPVDRACWSPTPSFRSTCSKATEKAEVDHFIASLPSNHMFGSTSRRGGQTLAERHLVVEIEGAEVCVAQRV